MKTLASTSIGSAVVVYVLTLALFVPVQARGIGSGVSQDQAEAWRSLQLTAVGTRIRLTFANGGRVEGRLVDADADQVWLRENRLVRGQVRLAAGTSMQDPQVFSRLQVMRLEILGRWPSYRSGGTPDPDAVRRVVEALGVGRSVDVRLGRFPRQRARIEAISADGFTFEKFSISRGRTDTTVLWAQVAELQPSGTSGGVKAALVAGAAALGVLLFIHFTWGDE